MLSKESAQLSSRSHFLTKLRAMSDLEILVVTFQTKLSDVMETVMKTAMYEVTRLVEDGLLLEMKRRNHEMESLRTKLLLAEKKLIGQEESDQGREPTGDTGAVTAVNLSRSRVEEDKGKVSGIFVSVDDKDVSSTNSLTLSLTPSCPG